MKASVIVPTYKDLAALKLILDAFERQTYRNFEVIIAEDDDAVETRDMLSHLQYSFAIKHYSHPDIGSTTKPKAVNAAVAMSEGEYLIYIDGDTIPYSTFVESHVSLAEPKVALCGRRVNLGEDISRMIREGSVSAYDIEKNYFLWMIRLFRDGTRHWEQGIYLKPHSWLQEKVAKKNKNLHLVGSNFSCHKQDMMEINGSDEDMPPGAGTDDVDIEWRLQAIGVNIKSCKNSANMFHLYHKRNDNRDERSERNRHIIETKQKHNQYRCKNGILKLNE